MNAAAAATGPPAWLVAVAILVIVAICVNFAVLLIGAFVHAFRRRK